jgi:hypothetical protein
MKRLTPDTPENGSEQPTRRPLKIFASDPMYGRAAGNRTTIEVLNEPDLGRGPRGSRLHVIDYDGANNCFYEPVDLNDDAILMRGGLEPSESDPRFHQQMVYAVGMKVIENFERALGRRFDFYDKKPLRLLPHGFYGANAFYARELHAIVFGYFRAHEETPGPNLPGQTVFTCLSHDIIAHEMTHALTDRLRRYFIESSNADVAGFHEGFSDIVAIFQHFTFPDILREQIQRTRTDLRQPSMMVELAQQYGYATGSGQALRSAVDDASGEKAPDPTLYQTVFEPHERGSILVAAVFEGFFRTYQRRIADLIRIATGGTGRLPEGDLHPDLVNRIAAEAARTAQSVLTMCIRAFEYLPPIDITFGDYLRALVTADFELNPNDDVGQRAAMIEAFRRRGIYPDNVISLAEESLKWEPADQALPPIPTEHFGDVSTLAGMTFRQARKPGESAKQFSYEWSDEVEKLGPDYKQSGASVFSALRSYAQTHAIALALDPARDIEVQGAHPVFRVGQDGQLLIEIVAQFVQKDETSKDDFGGVPFRGGTTIVTSADGKLRYTIKKPLMSKELTDAHKGEATRRLTRQREFVAACDMADPNFAFGFGGEGYYKNRISKNMSFAAIHRGIR